VDYTNILTIAIPVFERKYFFNDALNSALNQTVRCIVVFIEMKKSSIL